MLGKKGVFEFYSAIGDIVLWNSGEKVAVADWGIADKMWFHQMSTGEELVKICIKAEKSDGLYLVSTCSAFIWPCGENPLLKGEHLYEDKSTLTIEVIDKAEYMMPERVREFTASVSMNWKSVGAIAAGLILVNYCLP